MIQQGIFIYLDESGDLGFDHTKSGTNTYFTITLLVCDNYHVYRNVRTAVTRTLKKLNGKKYKNRIIPELKATDTSLTIKNYFLNRMPPDGWALYAISVNKERVHHNLRTKLGKKKLYNFLTKEILKSLPTFNACAVNLVVDKSKDSADRKDFNAYIRSHFETTFPLNTKIFITHENSQENPGLQAVDLFCGGIQNHQLTKNNEWYAYFKSRIAKHILYLS